MKNLLTMGTTVVLGLTCLAANADEPMFSKSSRWMTGDWGGLRTKLLEKGYDLQFSYQSEMAVQLKGGYRKGFTGRYTDQFNFGGAFDLQKILGINNAQFLLLITERKGRDLTGDRLTDPRTGTVGSAVQENWGRGQTWRITRMAYQQTFFDNVLDIKGGRLPIGDDFDSTGCVFQNNSLCGGLVAHASTVLYNSPVGQWGGRVKVNFTPEYYAQLGAYEYNPTLLDRHNGFKLSTSGGLGTTYMGEIGWTPTFKSGMVGKYMLGAYTNTATANDVLYNRDRQYRQLYGGSADSHGSRYGWYVYGRQQITIVNGDANRGLSLFAHYAAYDKRSSTLDYQVQLGALYAGPFDARPQDSAAIGFSQMHINPALNKNQRLHNQAKGLQDYSDPAFQPVQTAEYAAEVHYDYLPTHWLMMRPNLQYLINPGAVTAIDNALVFGLTVNTVF